MPLNATRPASTEQQSEQPVRRKVQKFILFHRLHNPQGRPEKPGEVDFNGAARSCLISSGKGIFIALAFKNTARLFLSAEPQRLVVLTFQSTIYGKRIGIPFFFLT